MFTQNRLLRYIGPGDVPDRDTELSAFAAKPKAKRQRTELQALFGLQVTEDQPLHVDVSINFRVDQAMRRRNLILATIGPLHSWWPLRSPQQSSPTCLPAEAGTQTRRRELAATPAGKPSVMGPTWCRLRRRRPQHGFLTTSLSGA